jgi:hypothetical protein
MRERVLALGADATHALEADDAAAVGEADVEHQLADAEHRLEGRRTGLAGGLGAQQRHADVLTVFAHEVDQLEVSRLEHVERQDHPGQQHHVGQREDRQRAQHLSARDCVGLEHRVRLFILSPLSDRQTCAGAASL